MPKVLHPSTISAGGAVTGAVTRFYPIGVCANIGAGQATEANAQQTCRSAGTFSDLYVRVTQNSTTAASTYNFRIASAFGSETLSVGSASTGEFHDAVNTDVIAAGSAVDVEGVIAAGGSLTNDVISTAFNATNNIIVKLVNSVAINISAATSTGFMPVAGAFTNQATETNVQFKDKTTGTLTNMFIRASANARTTATTFSSRVNGGAGSLTISIGSASSGYFEDLTHSDIHASGSTFNNQFITGTSTTNLTLQLMGVEYVNSVFSVPILSAAAPVSFAAAGTKFVPIGGLLVAGATEANIQTQALTTYTASNLEAFASANAATAASTINFRVAGVTGSQTISIGSASTGYFEDTIHTDIITSTSSELNYQVITGAGGALTLTNIGHWLTFPSGVVFSVSLLPLLGVG